MKKFFLLSFVLVLVSLSIFGQECDMDVDPTNTTSSSTPSYCSRDRLSSQNGPLESNPISSKIVRVIFHVIQDDNGMNNFDNIPDLQNILDEVNYGMKNLPVQNPAGSCPYDHTMDGKIEFILNNAFFYQDSDDWCTDTKCSSLRNELRAKYVTNNSNLSSADISNNLHIILISHRGERAGGEYADCNDDGCGNPNYALGGAGHGAYFGIDQTVVYMRGSYQLRNNTEEYRGIFLHEIGHSLGLPHSFSPSDRCCDVNHTYGITNNALDYSSNQETFTECQLGIMHYYLENDQRSILEQDLCVRQENINITIGDGEIIEWTQNAFVSEDIIVEGTLIIYCDLYMATDASIKIKQGGKLLVDGGRITSCDSGAKWQGVKVNGGGNLDFDVQITNGAVIENATAAVSMYPWGLTWPEHKNQDNGILLADNSSFNNCGSVAAFISHAPKVNISSIVDCTINTSVNAITNWNCQNIDVHNNEFNNISNNCIHTIDGSFIITENEFHSSDIDVLFMRSMALNSSLVEDNDFFGPVGIRSDGSDNSYNKFIDNNFDCLSRAIDLEGHNFFLAENNDILNSSFGILCSNTGNTQGNLVFRNDFSSNLTGLFSYQSNPELKFEENCFQTTVADVYLLGAEVSSHQGKKSLEAGNCFSISHDNDLYSNGSTPFDYYIYYNETNDCRDVESSTTNGYNLVSALNDNTGFSTCGQQNLGGGEHEHETWDGLSLSDLGILKQDIENDISNLITNGATANASDISYLESLLGRLTGYMIERNMDINDFSSARNLMNPTNNQDHQILWYSSFIAENDFSSASTYINNLTPSNVEMQDYVTVQQMNLQRLELGPNYNPSSNELLTLSAIAHKQHPYAAYARGLHFALTGEVIHFEYSVPEMENRSAYGISDKEALKIYPNPANDHLKLELPQLNSDEILLEIYDLMGNLRLRLELEKNTLIDIGQLASGVYLINLYESKNMIEQRKMVITR